MSHTTKIKTVPIKDRAALEAAVQELIADGVRCSLTENKAPRMYRRDQFKGDTGKATADLCLELHDGEYDVGFVLQGDGSYEIVFDSWAGNVHKFLGAKAGKHAHSGLNGTQADLGGLMQLYSKHAAINAAVAQGYYVEETVVDEQGHIHLTLGGM
jgi:hypothetical protein